MMAMYVALRTSLQTLDQQCDSVLIDLKTAGLNVFKLWETPMWFHFQQMCNGAVDGAPVYVDPSFISFGIVTGAHWPTSQEK